jgi:hypothetical protein
MVRASITLLKDAGHGICKTLSQILVCPLSKQPLRSLFLYLFLWFVEFVNSDLVLGFFEDILRILIL